MRARAYWLCQLCGWGAYVVITILELAEISGVRRFLEPLLSAAVGILLTHSLRRIAKARGWVHLKPGSFAWRLASAIAIVVVLHVGTLAVIELGFYGDHHDSPILVFVGALIRWSEVFFVWSALYFGVAVFRERQRVAIAQLELARALQAAELRALKSQLNPHFLFNSLNSVRALIADDPNAAQTAVTQLARTLRYALGAGKADTVRFEQELQIVDDYIGLEALRLAERLAVERAISADTAAARVPVMLLQILVENAIKHGIAQLPNGGTLAIAASCVDGALVLRVENPRPRATPALEEGNGIALANATERLRLLFGSSASLELDLSRPDHAIAIARIPQ